MRLIIANETALQIERYLRSAVLIEAEVLQCPRRRG